jgi:hypothetical protein
MAWQSKQWKRAYMVACAQKQAWLLDCLHKLSCIARCAVNAMMVTARLGFPWPHPYLAAIQFFRG